MIPGVLRVADFRNYWFASLASNAGSWLQVVAAGWLVYQITESPAAVGLLALLARAPAIVLSVTAGRFADRHDRRNVGIATFALQAVGAGALAVTSAFGEPSLLVIYVATLVVGIGFALGLPAVLAMVGQLAGPERLADAVALNAAGINIARLVGPTLGGVVLAFGGPAWCFAINGLSFTALVVVLLRLPRFPPAAPGARAPMREAISYAWRTPAPRRLLLGMALFAGLAAPVQELAPVVTADFGRAEIGLGILLGALGAGAILGAWLIARLGRRGYPSHHSLPFATTVFALATGLLVVAPWYPLAVVAMFIGGIVWIWLYIATNACLQLRSPPPLLGRMLGLYQLSVLGPIAIGSQLVGVWAEVVGIRWALGSAATLLGCWGLYSLANRVPSIDGDPDEHDTGLIEGILATRHRRHPHVG